MGEYAAYVAFGRAMGYMTDPSDSSRAGWIDVHGGQERSATIPKLAILRIFRQDTGLRAMRFGFTIMSAWYVADYDTLKILDRIKMKSNLTTILGI
jgi:hypothetical protein